MFRIGSWLAPGTMTAWMPSDTRGLRDLRFFRGHEAAQDDHVIAHGRSERSPIPHDANIAVAWRQHILLFPYDVPCGRCPESAVCTTIG